MSAASTKIDSFTTKREKLSSAIITIQQMLGVLKEADDIWVRGLLTDAGHLDVVGDPTQKSTYISALKTKVDAYMVEYENLHDILIADPEGIIDNINFDSPLVARAGRPWQVKGFAISVGSPGLITVTSLLFDLKEEGSDPEYEGPFSGFFIGDLVRVENAEDTGNNGFFEITAVVSLTNFSGQSGTEIVKAGLNIIRADGTFFATANTNDSRITITRVQKA